MSLSISLFALFFSLAGTTTPAYAEDKTAARDHWERGTKFYDLGKYDDAIREFESAYEDKGDPAFLYNLAQAHRLAGHPNDSLRFYRTYLRYVPKPTNRADIEERIKELEKIVADHPAGATAPSPSPQVAPTVPAQTETPATPSIAPPTAPQNAGPPTAASNPPASTAAPQMVVPEPQTAPQAPGMDAPPNAPPPSVHQGSGRRTAGIVLTGTGAGVMVVGAIFGLVTRSQSNKVETAANNGQAFDPSVQRLGKTSQTLQWVGYLVGGAALVAGVVLYATAPSAGSEPAPAPRVAVVPVVGPGTGGALLRMTF